MYFILIRRTLYLGITRPALKMPTSQGHSLFNRQSRGTLCPDRYCDPLMEYVAYFPADPRRFAAHHFLSVVASPLKPERILHAVFNQLEVILRHGSNAIEYAGGLVDRGHLITHCH